jgi:catechol 2,3-dioxygenase-like lactoylglutathione lyase family enzyme
MEKPVHFQRLQVALGVRDVSRSVAFYTRHLGFEVLSTMGDDDVEALHGACERDNVTIASALTTHPWGNRDFVIRDPDGHLIAIGESAKKVG